MVITGLTVHVIIMLMCILLYYVFSAKEKIVTDAGKLYVLDILLQRLKDEGHRVLIYSQMTKMIDLLEEYMWHRKHTYKRLDGSSKISERRDMVADFQARSDIFVFLLSTRAGGLGINLTAADTVIFYDSDWNPTVDQQAMDRAHRLGQTKQVTVYRLICKGTIEERILQRAKEKSEIQRMVISGGSFKPDTLKPKEVVSLLIEDDELQNKIKMRSRDKKDKEEQYKEKDRKRKREQYVKKRESKKAKTEEQNMTIPAPDTDSLASFDSSRPVSPQSELSVGSETPQQAMFNIDDSSNDALVIVDDASTTPTPTPKKTRGRGRPKGSGVGRGRPRGRGGTKRALSAAEIAGAQAGMTAAYKAYGYSYTGPPVSNSSSFSSLSDATKNSSNKTDNS
ncbi:chromatin-remodeling ATPase INO80-like [Ruditapes philippinarum]|uniref:chromatin-remodeling ATPase INO80-like n=1 Tax=Ruditapes philippinarum TaxID=129788 RepID=UPI00295B5E58|nr:chromatin-remodeling ATPase INO80-like [Ruditapes philippinarum]